MKIAALIAQHLLDVQLGGNWTEAAIMPTLADVSLAEAIQVTQASPNSIAAIVHHLAFWSRVMVQRLQGVAVVIPEHNGFNVPPLQTEKEWEDLKADQLRAAQELVAEIQQVEASRLEQPILEGYSSVYKNLQGTVEHIHYHLGQVVLLLNLIRS